MKVNPKAEKAPKCKRKTISCQNSRGEGKTKKLLQGRVTCSQGGTEKRKQIGNKFFDCHIEKQQRLSH